MKKLLIRILIALVVIVIVAVLAIGLSLDGAIKKGVETIGPQIAKVDVKLDSVNLSLLSGSAKIKGLIVGNPEGYKTPSAISVGSASVSVSPKSLLSDKIVVHSIRIESPQIIYELGPGGNNLKKIQSNVEASVGDSGGTSAPGAGKPGKKLQVDEVVVTGGNVTLGISALGGKVASAPLPEIHLTNLGQGPEGITAGELARRILNEITAGALKAASGAATDIGKGVVEEATKDLGKTTKGITDLLKKKK